jgi:hypothetical protein
VGATAPEIADDKYDVGVANAVSFLEKIETVDGEEPFLSSGTKVVNYKKRKDTGTDTPVPEVLLPLNCLIVHSEKGVEFEAENKLSALGLKDFVNHDRLLF